MILQECAQPAWVIKSELQIRCKRWLHSIARLYVTPTKDSTLDTVDHQSKTFCGNQTFTVGVRYTLLSLGCTSSFM